MPSRDIYEQRFPLPHLLAGADPKSRIRIVGSTLLLLMTRPEPIQKALELGAQEDLCCLDPDIRVINESTVWNPAVEPSDLKAAMERFQKLCRWVENCRPPGRLELRHHRISLIDTFASFELGAKRFAVCDLNMGPHVSAKKIFVVDPTKGLGEDLATRYDRIWNNAAWHYRYPGPMPNEPLPSREQVQK